jgi:outer membrane usher protein
MMRLRVLLLAGSATFWTATATAQVSVPLPRRPSPAPVPSAPSVPVPLPAPATGQAPVAVPLPGAPPVVVTPPRLNPYNRDLELTVPLIYQGKILGEMPIRLTKDDRLAVYQPGFKSLIDGMLNPTGQDMLAQKLGTKDPFFSDDLTGSGVELKYDPGSLSVAVLAIDPGNLKAQALFAPPEQKPETPDLLPAQFSGFMNLNASHSYGWQPTGRRTGPTLSVNGATRYGRWVVEAAGQLRDDSGGLNPGDDGGYRFDREYTRLVYDQPEHYRRWMLGDLVPEIRGQQGYVQLAGLGVSRQRRRFNQDRTAILQANRQIVLQNESTVSIYRNGVLFKQDKLQAGPYDLTSLPLLAGGNDIQIQVRDSAGRVQNIDYSSYSDPIDLVPGDHEYGAYIGVIADSFSGSPRYSSEVAFTGFFRKAFLNAPAIGIGLQATKRMQQVTGQTQFYFWNGSRLQLDTGLSHSDLRGMGYAFGVQFDKTLNRDELVDSFVLRADYTSRRFGGISADDPDNSNQFSLNAQYTRAFTSNFYVTGTASYLKNRNTNDSYRFGLSGAYRFNPKWSIRVGVDYARLSTAGGRQNGFGGLISLVFQPHIRDRFEARYESGSDSASLAYNHSGSGRIGSLDYGLLAQRESDAANLQAYAQYTASRFDASFSQSTYGDGIGGIGQNQVSTVQIGTSIAFADGHIALSRRISDSFAILYAHPTLRGHAVVAGQSLEPGDFISRSGTFGGAVNNYMASYVDQSVTYDVQDPPPGYDIGPGTYRVRPAYRSGYAIQIGTEAFVSAVGTLVRPDGKPVSLIVGSIVSLDRPQEKAMQFFTNTAGRFAAQNLRPGGLYRVDLSEGRGNFTITVPPNSDGLLQMNQIQVDQGEAR